MNVLVITIVALNPGDAAILLGTVGILKRALPGPLRVVAVDRHADVCSRLYPWMKFVPSLFSPRSRSKLGRLAVRLGYGQRLRKIDRFRCHVAARLLKARLALLSRLFVDQVELQTIEEYVSADLIVASGGTYLVPAYNTETPLLDYEFVRSLNKRLLFMPQSLGPFPDRHLARRFREVFSGSVGVFVRDGQSRQHLEDISVDPSKITVVPDAAFALVRHQSQGWAKNPEMHGHGLAIAISVRDWKHFDGGHPDEKMGKYIEAIADLVCWLKREKNAAVTFISSCQGIPEYWTDDSRLAREIVKRLPADVRESVVVDGKFRDPEALATKLQDFNLVVATRMHVAILALCRARFVVPIAYEFKTAELFRSIGLERLVCDIDGICGEAIIGKVDSVLESRGEYAVEFEKGVSDLSSQVNMIVELVKQSLAGQRHVTAGDRG